MGRINGPTGAGAALAMIAAQLAPAPALLAPVGLVQAQAQQRTQQISCFSSGNRPNTCRLPDNVVSVSFMGPDRSGRCIQGQTWAQRGNGLWVSGGCGGTFEVVTRGNGGGWGGAGGNQGGGWGSGGGNWGGGSQGFAGEITCRSRDGRTETCSVNTQGRVEMLQQYSSSACIEGRSWRANRNSITVSSGCQARFGYGFGNSGGGSGGGGWGGGSQGFAGQLECRSDNNRYRRCGANTENRAELLRQFSSASCTRGRSWGWDRGGIWVDNGCQGRFGYGYGNVRGDTSGSGGGSDTGAIIGGVALAAGLVALLAAAGKSNSRSASGSAAAIDADLAHFPSDARTPGQACLNEAARQIGQTGGTRVRLDSVDGAIREGNGWSIQAGLTGTYPDHSQRMVMDCRATGDRVTAFDVR